MSNTKNYKKANGEMSYIKNINLILDLLKKNPDNGMCSDDIFDAMFRSYTYSESYVSRLLTFMVKRNMIEKHNHLDRYYIPVEDVFSTDETKEGDSAIEEKVDTFEQLTTKELSEAINVPVATIKTWLRKVNVPNKIIGGVRYFDKSSVDIFKQVKEMRLQDKSFEQISSTLSIENLPDKIVQNNGSNVTHNTPSQIVIDISPITAFIDSILPLFGLQRIQNASGQTSARGLESM